jgi:NitT/TauT family transport system ATP-binding protein
VVLRRASASADLDPADHAHRQAVADGHGGGPVLSVRGLGKDYAIGRAEPKVAVQEVSFDVRRGEFVCVVGPSGAGKTTLLRCLTGLTPPSRGEVLLDGEPVRGASDRVGVVFQDYGRSLFPWMSVARNIALPLKVRGAARAEQQRVIEEVLGLVGLPGLEDRYPWQLSGGMQQRVAIARALAYRPELLFMDEPYASVDAQARAELEDVIADIHGRLGVTVFFVTHDIDEAVYLADRVVVLSSSPALVREVVEVALERPRTQLATKSSGEFIELRKRVFELVAGGR